MHVKEDEPQDHEFQIAPMVDVVFMLVIFFMLSAAMASKEDEFRMDLAVPEVNVDETKRSPPIEIGITADGTVLFNGLEVGKPDNANLDQLQARLEKAIRLFGDGQRVILDPAPSAVHQRIMQVVDCCATAQVKALSFARSR